MKVRIEAEPEVLATEGPRVVRALLGGEFSGLHKASAGEEQSPYPALREIHAEVGSLYERQLARLIEDVLAVVSGGAP